MSKILFDKAIDRYKGGKFIILSDNDTLIYDMLQSMITEKNADITLQKVSMSDSFAVNNKTPDESIDLVYLPYTDNIYCELEMWFRTVKNGGMICGLDDGDSAHPGIVYGVNDYFGQSIIPDTNHRPFWAVMHK